jgi:hypothetical protein
LAAVIDNGERQWRVMDGGTVLGDGLHHVNALPLISWRVESQSGLISNVIPLTSKVIPSQFGSFEIFLHITNM